MVGDRNSRPLLSSDDENWEIYYAVAVPELERIRRRLEDEEGGDGKAISPRGRENEHTFHVYLLSAVNAF